MPSSTQGTACAMTKRKQDRHLIEYRKTDLTRESELVGMVGVEQEATWSGIPWHSLGSGRSLDSDTVVVKPISIARTVTERCGSFWRTKRTRPLNHPLCLLEKSNSDWSSVASL